MARARWLASMAAVALAVVACDPEADDAEEAAPSPTPPAAAPEGDVGDEPDEPDDAEGDGDVDAGEVAQLVDDITAEIEEIRGLERETDIDTSVVDRDELLDVIAEVEGEAELEPALDEEVLTALRLLPEDVDLDEVFDDLLSVAVGGVYVPRWDEAFVAAETWPLSPLARTTVAHEVVHGLQDQHVDLTRGEALSTEDPDASMAFSSVVEGDAVLTEQRWADERLSEEEQQERAAEEMEIAQEAQGVIAEAPDYALLELMLPYEVGPPFVSAVLDDGGVEALDATLADPPATSVEIYDPQLHLDGFDPADVPSLSAPGQGWDERAAGPFGAYLVAALYPMMQMEADVPALWRGGQLEAWDDGGDVAVGVSLTFADDGADRLCERLPPWYEQAAGGQAVGDHRFEADGDAMALECDAEDVRFALAPDLDEAEAIVDG